MILLADVDTRLYTVYERNRPKLYCGLFSKCVNLFSDCFFHLLVLRVLCEAAKHGDLQLDMFSNWVFDAFIAFLCTKFIF